MSREQAWQLLSVIAAKNANDVLPLEDIIDLAQALQVLLRDLQRGQL